MPDVLDILMSGWKKIVAVMNAATAIALLVSLLLPNEYLSVATALPANSVATDKAKIFNNNIEALYPDIGNSDELDKIIGTATLDTIYISTAQKFNLARYYQSGNENGNYKAALHLKEKSKVIKSAYGELKVEVWDKDKNMAAALANELLQQLQQIHQSLQNESNALVLKKIKEDYNRQQQLYRQTADSLATSTGALHDIFEAQKAAQLAQLQQYQSLISEYNLMLNTNPQVLLVVEKARPSLKPDRPKRLAIALVTFFASGVFAFLVLLFLQSRKINATANS